ncbi:hypothetical protein EDC01DRAFT_781532 [Geopyxis carbonaria]|nr:hypothetical protein EDC01DRAFT_781532 [Geopyxis carbonaria]
MLQGIKDAEARLAQLAVQTTAVQANLQDLQQQVVEKKQEINEEANISEDMMDVFLNETAAVEGRLANLQEQVIAQEAAVVNLDKKMLKQKKKAERTEKTLNEELSADDPMMDRLLDGVFASMGYTEDSIGHRR